jgi:hypothetical protein
MHGGSGVVGVHVIGPQVSCPPAVRAHASARQRAGPHTPRRTGAARPWCPPPACPRSPGTAAAHPAAPPTPQPQASAGCSCSTAACRRRCAWQRNSGSRGRAGDVGESCAERGTRTPHGREAGWAKALAKQMRSTLHEHTPWPHLWAGQCGCFQNGFSRHSMRPSPVSGIKSPHT